MEKRRRVSPLAQWRAAAGFTQESFAERMNVCPRTVRRWESGEDTPRPRQRGRLALELMITPQQLHEALYFTKHESDRDMPVGGRDQASFVDVRDTGNMAHSAIPQLRWALDSVDCPDEGPYLSIVQLQRNVGRMIEHRLQARYTSLAQHLPNLIGDLARVYHSSHGAQRRRVAYLLTLAYRAADGWAYKLGYLDLSARLIDLMRTTAIETDDPLLLATIAYVRTETFFASRDLDRAERILNTAAERIETNGLDSSASAALYGALHMRAAVVAGRASKPNVARAHLVEARHAARHAPEGVYCGTAFGPCSVRIHELAVAVELGDQPAVVQRASTWQPPPDLPAERRSHYYIDLACAQLRLGHHNDTYTCLELARQIAPEHTRTHPRVQPMLTILLNTQAAPRSGIRDLVAWAHVG